MIIADKFLAGSLLGVATIVCLVVLLLFAFVVLAFAIVQKLRKNKSSNIGFIENLLSNDKAVKTVYSYKDLNYSGTENLEIPEKPETKEFTYEFVGWDKLSVDKNGKCKAKPIYIKHIKKFFINVYNEDREELLKTAEVEYGAGIDLSDVKVEKPETKEFVYEFAGWDKNTNAFYKNENVYAVFNAIPKKYTYKFLGKDGKTIIKEASVVYGTPIIAPKMPKKDIVDEDYEFAGWKGYEKGMKLEKDETFVAIYKKPSNKN